tara:strand:+ start:527 stop:778 length:252 start_codon:yes stop_codon:yes gene_type:complete
VWVHFKSSYIDDEGCDGGECDTENNERPEALMVEQDFMQGVGGGEKIVQEMNDGQKKGYYGVKERVLVHRQNGVQQVTGKRIH